MKSTLHPQNITQLWTRRYSKGSCMLVFVILEKHYLCTEDFVKQLLTYKQAGLLGPK